MECSLSSFVFATLPISVRYVADSFVLEMLCLVLNFDFFFSWKWTLCFGRPFCLFGAGVYQGDHEEIEEENSRAEFLCPFCAEDFDIVGLYCHVDEEHPVEVKNAVCRFYNFDL